MREWKKHIWMTLQQNSIAKGREDENRTLGGKQEPLKGVAPWRYPSMLPGANEGKGRDLKIQERVVRGAGADGEDGRRSFYGPTITHAGRDRRKLEEELEGNQFQV